MTAGDPRTAPPRTAVVGAGALGQLYAATLNAAAPGRVTLFTRRPDVLGALRREIVVTQPARTVRQVGLDVQLLDDAVPPDYDIVLVLVSAYDTARVAPLVRQLLRPAGLCLTFQNGLGNRPALARVLGEDRVSAGATSFAVHLEGPGAVHVDGNGLTWVPALPEHLASWHALVEAAGLNPTRIDDPQRLLWRKAAIATNGYISLILAAPLGQVVRTEGGRQIAKLASLEITRLAVASGVALSEAEVTTALETAWAHCNPQARSSLYSDYLAGRRTELEERLGDLLDRARALAIPVPTLEALHLLAQARLALGSAPAA